MAKDGQSLCGLLQSNGLPNTLLEGHDLEIFDSDSEEEGLDDTLADADIDKLLDASKKKKKRTRTKKSKLTPQQESLYGQANASYLDSKFADAVEILNEVIHAAPKAPKCYELLGNIYEATNRVKEAIQAYTITAALTAKDPDRWKQIARMSVDIGNFQHAIFCYTKAIRANPEDLDSRQRRASAHFDSSDYKRAADGYLSLLKKSPIDGLLVKHLAECHYYLAQSDKAISVIEEYIVAYKASEQPIALLDPNCVNVLADLYIEGEHFEKCIALIQRFDQDTPGELPVDLSVQLGVSHLHSGNLSQAEVLFSRVLTGPEGRDVAPVGDLFYKIGEAYYQAGHIYRAINTYDRLQGIPAFESPLLWRKRAHCLKLIAETKQDCHKAIEQYQRVLDAEPQDQDAALCLSQLYQELKEYNLALQVLDSVDTTKGRKPRALKAEARGADSNDLSAALRNEADLQALTQKTMLYFNKGEKQEAYNDFIINCLPAVRASIDAAHTMVSPAPDAEANADDHLIKVRTNSRAKRRKRNLPHPCSSLVGQPAFLHLIMMACKSLSQLNRHKEACVLVKKVQGWGSGQKASIQVQGVEAQELMNQIRHIAVAITVNAGDYEAAYKHMRYVVTQLPNSFDMVHVLNLIINKLKVHTKCVRFVERLLVKHPESIPLRVLAGHAYLMHQNYDYALDQYAHVHAELPDNPTINMFMGIATLQQAMLRRTVDRHHGIVSSFSFFDKYRGLRNNDAEACYNVGRAHHYIGTVHLAVHFYRECLRRVGRGQACLVHEAAHNLACVYRESGSPELARAVYMEYNTM